jgi:hypothetical protein
LLAVSLVSASLPVERALEPAGFAVGFVGPLPTSDFLVTAMVFCSSREGFAHRVHQSCSIRHAKFGRIHVLRYKYLADNDLKQCFPEGAVDWDSSNQVNF